MAEPPADFDLVLTEHEHLSELFSRICVAVAASGTSREQMIALLDELKTHVLQHFAHEEDGGLFQQITSKAPRLEHEATLLEEQHVALAASLEDIAQPLAGDAWDAKARLEMEQRFRDFLAQFKEHEEGENRLLQEAYDRDVGSKD